MSVSDASTGARHPAADGERQPGRQTLSGLASAMRDRRYARSSGDGPSPEASRFAGARCAAPGPIGRAQQPPVSAANAGDPHDEEESERSHQRASGEEAKTAETGDRRQAAPDHRRRRPAGSTPLRVRGGAPWPRLH